MSPDQFKNQYFPQLENQNYLASCSLGARSTVLEMALATLLEDMSCAGNAWSLFEKQTQQAKSQFSKLIGTTSDRIALIANASIGAYQIASTLDWSHHSKLVFPNDEFPSIAHVWYAQKARGARPVSVSCGGSWEAKISAYAKHIDQQTKMVSIPYTSYLDGSLYPHKAIIELSKMHGAKVFIDAYQAVGIEPINVIELDCDYLVAGTMKYLLGLPGLAFLYVKEGEVNDFDPQLTGWFGRKHPFAFDPHTLDFPTSASRFETGTPSTPSIYAAVAGMELISRLNIKDIQHHIGGLMEYLASNLQSQGEYFLNQPIAGRHGGVLAIVDSQPEILAEFLQSNRIRISPRNNVARISFHYFNNYMDVDRLCHLMRQYRNL